MKKGLMIVVIVLAVVLLAPFGFGYWADQRVDALLEEIAETGVLQTQVVKRERGWLRSTNEVRIEIRGDIARSYEEYQRKAGAEVEPLQCTVRNVIHHGPIPFTEDTRPAVAIMHSQLIAGPRCAELQERMNLKLRTLFAFDGGGTSYISTPEQSVTADQGRGLVHWRGLDAEVEFSGDFERVRTKVVSPGLELKDPSADVIVRELRWSSDVSEGLEGLDLGQFEFTVQALEVHPKTGDGLDTTITEMSLRGASTEGENATVDTEVTLRAERLRAGDLDFGPAQYALALRNMDAAAMAKITETLAEARRKNLPEQQAGMLVGATLLGLLPDILKKGPVLEVTDLSIASPFGTAAGAARMTVDTSDPAVLQNPMLLAQAVIVDASLKIPEDLLVALAKRSIAKELASAGSQYSEEQINALARMRVRQGMASEQAQQWFVLDEGTYRLDLHMEQGRMTLNGQAVQPGALAP